MLPDFGIRFGIKMVILKIISWSLIKVYDSISKVRDLIKKIHQVSQLKTKLSAYCVCNNEPSIVPTLDTKIRWNSLLDFCIQTLRIFKSLVQLSSIKEIAVVLTMADKEAIDDFIYILTPFKKTTIDLCGENDINGSKVYLILKCFKSI